MGSPQENQLKQTLNITNNMFVDEENICSAQCTAVADNIGIIINNSTVFGGVDVESQCSTNVACVMNNQLSQQVQNMLSAAAQQTQSSESSFFSFPSKQKNTSNQTLTTTNNLTSILTNTCQGNTTSLVENINVIINGSTIGEGVYVGATGSASATCTMANVAKIRTYNSEQATADQKQKQYNVFAIIAIAIVIGLIVFAVIILLIFFLRGGNKYRANYVGNSQPPQVTIVDQGSDQSSPTPVTNAATAASVSPSPQLSNASSAPSTIGTNGNSDGNQQFLNLALAQDALSNRNSPVLSPGAQSAALSAQSSEISE